MFDALIRTVATVIASIADVRFVNATRIATLVEPVRACNPATLLFIRMVVAIVRTVAVPSDRYADARCPAPKVFLLVALVRFDRRATELIASIITVRDAVTFVRFLNALTQVSALELVRQAGDRWAILFVLLVETIVITVAHPALRNAMAGPGTRELEVSARLLRAERSLVRTVATVVFAVAFPDVRDAAAILARKLRRRARHIRTLELVRMVAAVILLVTPEVEWDAPSRLALKLVSTTRWLFGRHKESDIQISKR